MIDKKYSEINLDNADKICARIREDADSQIKGILNNAEAQKKSILETAQREGKELETGIVKQLDSELEKAKQKIFSLASLEKKRLILENKNRFVEDILKTVMNIAGGFRRDVRYKEFLLQCVNEGAGIVNHDELVVLYSSLDEEIITKGFEENAKKLCDNKFIQFKKTESFKDIGLIVQAVDGTIIYDNRFSMRVKRKSEELYARLLKEMV